MNYKVTYFNDFTEPFYSNQKVNGRNVHSESWILESKEDCIQCVKDFLDVPEAELTLEQIKSDFGSNEYPISNEKANEIKTYYNGRLEIYNKFLKDFDNMDYFNYDIPEKYNSFNVTTDLDLKFKQNKAYLKVELTNETM